MKGKFSTSGLYCVDYERLRQSYDQSVDTKNELIHLLKLYHKSDHIVLFNSGFWALVAALRIKLNRKKVKGVLMPSLTYRRLADVVYWAGGTPVFADVDARTLALCAHNVEDLLSVRSDVGVVLLVQPVIGSVDVSTLLSVCNRAGVDMVVDSVESPHDTIGGVRTGSFPVNEVFSVHASKFINGFEGGYVAAGCYEEQIELENFKKISEHFSLDINKYHAHIAACNLKHIDEFVRHNKEIYDQYQIEFSQITNFPLEIKTFDVTEQCGYKNIVACCTATDIEQLCNHLNANGVAARQHYQPPLHLKEFQYDVTIAQELRVTENVGRQLLNLPCGWRFSVEDVQFVIRKVEDYFGNR